MADSLLDECALMIGDERGQVDRSGERHSYATIIQEQWVKYVACRPLMSMRTRAVNYSSWEFAFGQQQEHQQQLLHQSQQHHSQWQIFSAALIQALWRGRRSRRDLQLLKSSSHILEFCVTRIQSRVRGNRQRRQYVRLKEAAVVVQTFVHGKWASARFKQALSSVLRIQRSWRKALRDKPAASPPFTELGNGQAKKSREVKIRAIVRSNGPQGLPENNENDPLSSPRLSVARMITVLESVASSPVFPLNELDARKSRPASSPRAINPDARAGEWSPEKELRGITREISQSLRVTVADTEKTRRPLRSGKKRRSRRKRREEKMRNLSIECIDLWARMKNVPERSPEWTLCKIEMKLISEELRYLYVESMAKRARV